MASNDKNPLPPVGEFAHSASDDVEFEDDKANEHFLSKTANANSQLVIYDRPLTLTEHCACLRQRGVNEVNPFVTKSYRARYDQCSDSDDELAPAPVRPQLATRPAWGENPFIPTADNGQSPETLVEALQRRESSSSAFTTPPSSHAPANPNTPTLFPDSSPIRPLWTEDFPTSPLDPERKTDIALARAMQISLLKSRHEPAQKEDSD